MSLKDKGIPRQVEVRGKVFECSYSYMGKDWNNEIVRMDGNLTIVARNFNDAVSYVENKVKYFGGVNLVFGCVRCICDVDIDDRFFKSVDFINEEVEGG